MGPGAPPPAARGNVAFVFAGGDRSSAASVRDLPPAGLVIAADSGVEHALALEFTVDLVVGDLDSADADALDIAVGRGAAIERHLVDKDATDLELALAAAQRRGVEAVVVIGGGGGRLDHFLANALLLASPRFSDLRISARIGEADAFVVRDAAEIHGRVGDLCSLLALGGPAGGVSTTGLRYPLDRETLLPGSTRGVSNEIVASPARVTLDDGVLLGVLPHAREES